jgi:hypothetical protein
VWVGRSGDPEGIRHLDQSNWSGYGVVFNRELFHRLRLEPGFSQAGIYNRGGNAAWFADCAQPWPPTPNWWACIGTLATTSCNGSKPPVGGKVLDRLASDLREAFPETKGFSSRNLKYMRFFAEHCPQQAIGQQPAAAQLPWFHIVVLQTKSPDAQARRWYAEQAIAQGWSRTTLELQVRNRLHERQGRAVTNVAARLLQPGSDLAHETLKDPYLFDFWGWATRRTSVLLRAG